MNILLTGGTGFIGSLLLPTLLGPSELGGGHRVTVLTRRPAKFSLKHQEAIACAQLRVIGTLQELTRDDVYDAIINLAGEGIADKPWSAQRKRELHDSRITLTEELVEWIRRAKQKPRVLISGSAIGWYGNQGDKVNYSSYGADRLLGFRRGTNALSAPQPQVNALAQPEQPQLRWNALQLDPAMFMRRA